MQNTEVLHRDQIGKLQIQEVRRWGGGKDALWGGAMGALVVTEDGLMVCDFGYRRECCGRMADRN